jgi:hypothetical protein
MFLVECDKKKENIGNHAFFWMFLVECFE